MKDLDSIYFAARELPPGERPAYLQEACCGDDPLRARVEQMLAVAEQAEAFITEPPDEMPGDRLEAPDETIGANIGRYKIRERLGEGGCGVVYVAEQIEPVRRLVALKVIKLGMDSKQVVARFEAERQALAMMDHPNIARVYDAGTTETGRPYFVMELVRGTRVTDYCDENHLSTRDRIDVFIKVCHAIQHAHQKGIIHRDIKPSNILVTLHDGVPVPKVIDFGIAKATEGRLTDATIYTQLHQFIGTPAYMSPEQAEMSGLDIDTRSDIYSLGVLLYELLAGCTPFDAQELMASGVDAMRRTIREQEPKRPSTRLLAGLGLDHLTTAAKRRSVDATRLLRQLIGDLDWIVMKCLEKDRTRRYETANGLANDLQRHLSNEPVTARAPSAAYKFQKAWQRNKIAFTAAGAVALALLAGAAISTWQAIRATKAQGAEVKQRIAAEKAEAHASAQQKKAELEKQRAEEQLARAERLVYASKLMMSQTDFVTGNGGLALHYLNECQQNLRGWEYRYLQKRLAAKQTFRGHRREIDGVAFSPDGKRIATASGDQTVKLWETATGRELLSLPHRFPVASVAFSPDGQSLVTGGGNLTATDPPGEVKVWDAVTGRERLDVAGVTGGVYGVAFSPDGRRIATAGVDRVANVWDATTGEKMLSIPHKGMVWSVAFSPDQQRIITGGAYQSITVWDATTGSTLLSLPGHAFTYGAAFSPDGRRIVITSGDTPKICEAATGQELFALKGHQSAIRGLAFSADGQRIVTASLDQTTKVWNAATGQELFTLKGHSQRVNSAAFSPDGQWVLTGSHDGTAKLWDAQTGQEIPTLRGHSEFISGIAFSPNAQKIVTASGDGTARIWDAATGRKILTLQASASAAWSVGALWSVAYSPDGRQIITGSQEKKAVVWDAATGQQLLTLPHADVVSSVAFSPDGRQFATGVGSWWSSPDKGAGEAKLWEAATGRELTTLKHAKGVWSVAFSPDGRHLVTGGGDPAAKVWDTATGQEIRTLAGHLGALQSVAFSPDGRFILTGSHDKTAKVWESATGRLLLTLQGHTGPVRTVTFSPDGQRIVTGGEDRTVRLWDATTGQEVLCLQEHTHEVWSLAFSPDGHRLVTGIAGAGATAKVWSAAPPSDAPRAADMK